MKLSVIVASYNRPEQLIRCLSSLLAQTRLPDEIVVATKTYDEVTVPRLNEFTTRIRPQIKIVNVQVSEHPVVFAENRAVEVAIGEIVCFIDDDAEALSDWIERIENWFADPQIGAVGGPDILVQDGRPVFKMARRVGLLTWWGEAIGNTSCLVEEPLFVDHLRGCNMSFRKSILGRFDENIVDYCYRFELDACLSIRKKGYKVLFDPNVRVYHYPAPFDYRDRTLWSQRIFTNWRNSTYVLMKHLPLRRKLVYLLFVPLFGRSQSGSLLWAVSRMVKTREVVYLDFFLAALRGHISGARVFLSLGGAGWLTW